MSKRVLDVGNCNPDHSSITYLLESNFDVEVSRTHGLEDTLQTLQSQLFDLILVNRVMDRDGSPGLEIIQQIKDLPSQAQTPVMMITNYPDFQQAAIAAGAVEGFGKAELGDETTLDKLNAHLS